MNKKGFTLVELLAVIIILSLLALLTNTAVTKLVKDSKDELSDTQIQLIQSAAEAWGADNLLKLPKAGECSYLTLENLQKYGLIDSSIIDPNTNDEISPDLKIKITTTTSEYGNTIISYEVNPDTVFGCKQIYDICEPVTGEDLNYKYVYYSNEEHLIGEATYTTGTKSVGDAYRCQVNENDSYIFNIIGQDESGNYNLLLNHNLGHITADSSESIDAILASLTNLTDSWTNLDKRTDSYTDSLSDTGVNYTFDYAGYYARFIKTGELSEFAPLLGWSENSKPWISSIPKDVTTLIETDWMYVSSEITSLAGSDNGFVITGLGCAVANCSGSMTGIRPVITVSENQIK